MSSSTSCSESVCTAAPESTRARATVNCSCARSSRLCATRVSSRLTSTLRKSFSVSNAVWNFCRSALAWLASSSALVKPRSVIFRTLMSSYTALARKFTALLVGAPMPMLKNAVEYLVASRLTASDGMMNASTAARRPHSALSTWPAART